MKAKTETSFPVCVVHEQEFTASALGCGPSLSVNRRHRTRPPGPPLSLCPWVQGRGVCAAARRILVKSHCEMGPSCGDPPVPGRSLKEQGHTQRLSAEGSSSLSPAWLPSPIGPHLGAAVAAWAFSMPLRLLVPVDVSPPHGPPSRCPSRSAQMQPRDHPGPSEGKQAPEQPHARTQRRRPL